ncbi:MAG TPA: hypothetical protein VF449_03390 [Parvibaculum sp.]
MSFAALKTEFQPEFAAPVATRVSKDAVVLPWSKIVDRTAPAVRDTLAGHIGTSALATYALFNLAYVIAHYAI